ncbi:DUF6452 family protein [Maribacter sp. 2210JD10-5]|uniref:DUF6452 family protein n=1 Tax=Maribacter sp. 2210JD10-5 TaxID=3386272 RepID=UPI0039BD359D
MKKISASILILLILVGISACEKDDICVDGDTPLLVIEFLDATDSTAKEVAALRVVGIGQTTTVNTFTDRSNLESIMIPLKTDEDVTRFIFIQDSDGEPDTGNTDTLTVSYTRMEGFVSRACGFVISYENLEANAETDTDNWIQSIEIARATVTNTNSDSTHVKIYH